MARNSRIGDSAEDRHPFFDFKISVCSVKSVVGFLAWSFAYASGYLRERFRLDSGVKSLQDKDLRTRPESKKA